MRDRREKCRSEYTKEVKQNLLDFGCSHGPKLLDCYRNYSDERSWEHPSPQYIPLKKKKSLLRSLRLCKVLVITANSVEKAVLHHEMRGQESNPIYQAIYDDIFFYIFKWGNQWIAHVPQDETGAFKEYGTLYTLKRALELFRPNVIFSLGVAFGIDYTSQKIGNVLVSEKLLPYNDNKRDSGKIYPVRAQDKTIDHWLHVRLKEANGFFDINTIYGDMLTGGSVESCVEDKDKICLGYTDYDFVIGGEMEGNALYQIGPFVETDSIPCAVIKGICDWGVAKNDLFIESEDDSKVKAKDEIESEEENNKAIIKKNYDEFLKEYDPEDVTDALEDMFKTSLQAYAMSKVIEKCTLLFSCELPLFESQKPDDVFHLKNSRRGLVIALAFSLFISIIVEYSLASHLMTLRRFVLVLSNEILGIIVGVGIIVSSVVLFAGYKIDIIKDMRTNHLLRERWPNSYAKKWARSGKVKNTQSESPRE